VDDRKDKAAYAYDDGQVDAVGTNYEKTRPVGRVEKSLINYVEG